MLRRYINFASIAGSESFKPEDDEVIVKTEDLYMCNICFEIFYTYQSLLHHAVAHKEEVSCKCEICGEKFKFAEILNQHMQEHKHNVKNRPNALILNQELDTGSKILKKNKEISCRCKVCGEIVTFPNSFSTHMKAHAKNLNLLYSSTSGSKVLLGGYSVVCRTCDEVFYTRSDFIHHINTLHKKTYTCSICNKYCGNYISFNLHKRLHSDTKKTKESKPKKIHKCNCCNKIFSYFSNLRHHLKTQHSVKSDCKFACVICEKVLSSAANLSNHRQLHVLHPNRCTYCRKVVAKPGFLKKHMRKHKKFASDPT